MSHADDEVLGKAYDARLMRRLLTYLWPHRPAVVWALVTIIAHAGLQLVQPYLMKVAIDRHITTGDLSGLDRIAWLFLGVLLLSFVFEYAETYTLEVTGQRIMFDLRMQIYEHLQRLDLRFYDRNPVGRLMTRVTTDVDALNDLFASGVISVFRDVFMLVGIMVVLVVMDWRLAIVAFSVLPLIVVVTHWFRKNARHSYRHVRMWIARINAFLQENITGMATVQIFRREERNFGQFDAINRSHRDANIESIFYYAVFYPAIEVIGALATALIIWYGGGWSTEATLTLGSLVAFLQYSQRFFRPISDLSEKFNILQAAMASSERIFGLLDTPVDIVSPRPGHPSAAAAPGPPLDHPSAAAAPGAPLDHPSAAAAPGASLERARRLAGPAPITFDNVSFAYSGEDYVLRDVSFQVVPGERVAIVGATGAGKTTVINLLMRFYDVSKGRILIDGVDIREMSLSDLRSLFGLVLQDVYLFSGTIGENVRLGHEGISEGDIERAIAGVHADAFVRRLPAGLQSPVAERGATLSTGQKQLLSFARALAFRPQVLVLDEATSSVDTETELLIRAALRVLMAGRTTIAIAHRLSTVQDMDRILVLHKGYLREAGTHQELLARRGIYYRLYQLQYKEQETGVRRQETGDRQEALEKTISTASLS